MISINMKEFLNLKEKKNIIDIRSIEKYNNRHIPEAINIPSEKLILNPDKYLNKETKYYLYCQHGKTSYSVCKILSNMGYKTININGGYESFIMNTRNQ